MLPTEQLKLTLNTTDMALIKRETAGVEVGCKVACISPATVGKLKPLGYGMRYEIMSFWKY